LFLPFLKQSQTTQERHNPKNLSNRTKDIWREGEKEKAHRIIIGKASKGQTSDHLLVNDPANAVSISPLNPIAQTALGGGF
jgi:hypothetical protein